MKQTTFHPYTLTSVEREALENSDFGIPEKREFPMPDAEHVRTAEAYFRYAPEEKKALLAHRILKKAQRFGVHVKSEMILAWAEKYHPE